jgi:hypothetical protein
MDEDFSNLFQLQGGDIEFVVKHNDLHYPVTDVFPSDSWMTGKNIRLLIH